MGRRKLTNKYVRKAFLSEGYIIPNEWKYENCNTHIPYICNRNHNHYTTWDNWKQNYRCPYCSKNITKTTKEIKELFLIEGYTITDIVWKYKNSRELIPFKCPQNHYHKIRWNSWQQGNRCYYCYSNIISKTQKIKKSFINEKYIIKEDWVYKNTRTNIPYICPNNHEHQITLANWKVGHRCKWCSYVIKNLKRFKPEEKIQLYFIRIYDWLYGKETYKFGITKNTIEHRFKDEIVDWGFKIEVIRQNTATAEQICMLEQSLLYEVKDNRTKWVPKEFKGVTECFNLSLDDALNIWNKIVNRII